MYAYAKNNPVIMVDPNGYWPHLNNWQKIAIGVVALTAAVAITVATGGAAAPLLIGVAVSTLSGAAIEGAIGYVTGGEEGLKEGLVNGASDGFMWGRILAFSSAGANAIKAVKYAKQSKACGQLLDEAIESGDNIVGAVDGKKITKMFLTKDAPGGHRTFLEGTERGFTLVIDKTNGAKAVFGSGTAFPIGGQYLSSAQKKIVETLFGILK
jgi:hypothetical protein